MENEPRRPGTTSGIQNILEQRFKVSATPSIGREEAARRVRGKMVADGIHCERLDLSEHPMHRRALIDMAGVRVPFPPGAAYDRCYVALIDPDADAQWGHPAFWAFVPAEGNEAIVIQPTGLPEHAAGPVRFFPVPK